MNLRTFIERPILSSVISILIVIMGIIGAFSLPVEQFPNIAPPTVVVFTTYYGASAETLQKSVIAPLEQAINGVENMTYMTSSCSNTGAVTIQVFFRQGTNPDMAAVNVQNKVATATSQLPQEVTKVGVTTLKRQTSMLQVFTVYSPDDSVDENFISNYMNINLIPEISRIEGVGQAMVLGADYSMRLWLNPMKMAQYNLVPSDISGILAEQNIEAAAGTFGENSDATNQYVIKYRGRRQTPEEFGEMVITSLSNGEVLKLKDIARIELGQDSYGFRGGLDGHPGVTCMIQQVAGSNATAVNNQISAFLEEAEKDLPKGLSIQTVMTSNDFLYASIYEVIKTLIEAILLVILVVYVFLQDIRSTIIPLVGIFVSVIGTFAFMSVAGFSINLITLFALVLVIGTVVDDAIVVVEAVQARFDAGYKSSYMASIDAMKGISNAVITSSLVFMAVFIPVSFMPGTSGVFYTQFGLTMAVAVGISAVNALTLSPALCALLLRPYIDENGNQKDNFAARFRKAFNTAFDAIVERYKNGVLFFIHHKVVTATVLVVSFVGLVFLMNVTKTSLVPDEDQGVIMVNVTTPPGSSLATTAVMMNQIRERIQRIPKVKHVMSTAGYGLLSGQSSSSAMLIVRLEDWSERKDKSESVQAITNMIYGVTADIKGAQVFAMAPGMIPGYGMGNNIDMNVQDKQGGEMTDFFNHTMRYVGALNQRPEIMRAYTTFSMSFPQWYLDVDAAKCKRAGISPASVLAVMSGYYGGQYVSNFNRFNKIYKVQLQADPQYRLDESALYNTYVRLNNGEMAPVGQFVTLQRVYGAEVLNRFNMYSSIPVSVMPAPGYSTGEALNVVKETASQVLPNGYGYDFGGITREENEQSGQTAIIFGICILIIYLVLCALYESFIVPLAVILAVPCGLMGSFLFAQFFELENNIYLQTGLIMLIGLLAKTAILLTEYAVERRKAGMGLIESAVSAAKARLRPILMTALTMIFGLFPLMVAHGVGANGNRSLGTGAVGGMFIGTLALLFLVPALFVVFQWLQEKITPVQLSENLDIQIEEEKMKSKKEKEESRKK